MGKLSHAIAAHKYQRELEAKLPLGDVDRLSLALERKDGAEDGPAIYGASWQLGYTIDSGVPSMFP